MCLSTLKTATFFKPPKDNSKYKAGLSEVASKTKVQKIATKLLKKLNLTEQDVLKIKGLDESFKGDGKLISKL